MELPSTKNASWTVFDAGRMVTTLSQPTAIFTYHHWEFAGYGLFLRHILHYFDKNPTYMYSYYSGMIV